MTDLKIRKIPFTFDDVAFLWNPDNPYFSIAMNKLSFFAVGFERYICRATADAEAKITDPAILAEAKAFRVQESVHALAHRKHLTALIVRYPGLQQTLDKVIASYDELYASRDLKYHLAYIGGLESTFTPSMKLLIDNRVELMSKGDARVVSLLLWHFCEEIEHRSSGLAVYDHVFGDYLYRAKGFLGFIGHVKSLFAMMDEELKKHVPDVPLSCYLPDKTRSLPKMDRAKALYGIVMSQMPWHNPDHQIIPGYFHDWNKRYDAGEDVRQVYGVPRNAELMAAE
jgi:predicted metal-dependent hydrolase